jgi:hypothetical protein
MTKLIIMFNRLLIGFGLLFFIFLVFKLDKFINKDTSEFVQTLNPQESAEPPEEMVPLSNSITDLNVEISLPTQIERELDLSTLVDSPILEDLTLGFATTQDPCKHSWLRQKRMDFRVRDRSAELKTVRLRVTDLEKHPDILIKWKMRKNPIITIGFDHPNYPVPNFLKGRKALEPMRTNGLGTRGTK